MPDARGAVIEIIERRRGPADDSAGGDLIAPNEVRINGQILLCPADHPVRVHEVTINDGEAVMVTMTLFARRIEVKAEADSE